MTVNLLLYHFNNYYNRKLLVYDSINDYGTPLHRINDIQSFNPGDGVSTSHVINHMNIDINSVDYALITVGTMIISRWFVLDGHYTRNGQTVLTLYRDTIAEEHTNIFNAPMFIEKATVLNSSPYIYNSENITVNEIKKSETLLKDKTDCAWLVGYMARDYAGGEEIAFEANLVPDRVYSNIQDYIFYNYLGKERRLLDHYELYVKTNVHVPSIHGSTPFDSDRYFVYNPADMWWRYEGATQTEKKGTITATEISAGVTDPGMLVSDNRSINQALAEVGKILKVGNQYMKITSSHGMDKTYSYTLTAGMTAYNKAVSDISSIVGKFGGTINSITVQTRLVAKRWVTLWNPIVASGQFKVTIPNAANRYHLTDAPYDMFCLPYGNVEIKNTLGSSTFDLTVDKGITLSIAQGLKAAMSANIYDIQLLPYCPLTGYSVTNGVIDILNAEVRASTIVKTEAGTNVAPILWCTQSQSSLYIDYSFEVQNKKISVICDKLRFCSPNYSAAFELNPAKNDGVYGVNVDYTYMPFTPYIHVAPVFSGLYGENFGDARGLICQGDFSITTYDDKWADYQLNNKNYLNVFNREVQNIEVGNKIKRQEQLFQSITGSLTAGVAGAAAGASVGGPWGATAGAVIGTAAGVAGGAMDYKNMLTMQAENIDFKKDLFGYSLDNIQALPNTIAKITTITANNKLFPFVEYYTCTDEERIAVANKIRYNGMSVGVIGTINDYIANMWDYEYDGNIIEDRGYVKGQLIDVSALDCDYHMANAIAEELNKGIYIRGDN